MLIFQVNPIFDALTKRVKTCCKNSMACRFCEQPQSRSWWLNVAIVNHAYCNFCKINWIQLLENILTIIFCTLFIKNNSKETINRVSATMEAVF